ncbi:cytochrome c oxidase subunit VIIc [Pyrrhoderma noxium]|uniref:Cytochrome c oxidase subunit 8, mitochondrial n=1 Tax=Pyrrhoderma noxium TaxID=2282107 RepID=A0A286UX05_9AGAM|nr:cytochrome c oxidase subunit VIIc [Pyrrhoderma noxium]
MFVRSSATVLKGARARGVSQVRALHVENTVNNNFPFKYEKRGSFIAKSGAFMGFSFMIPFAACQFKKTKQ